MADGSHIEWTDATWNPITGCSIVSPGCANCYAMKLAGSRLKHHPSRRGLTQDTKTGPVWTGEVRFNEQWLDQPLRWQRPRRIFVCAHGDLFAEGVPDEWIDRVFAVMALAPQHTFQVLTKRASRMRAYCVARGLDAHRIIEAVALLSVAKRRLEDAVYAATVAAVNLSGWPLPNVWLGVSVEDQARADERIPPLLDTPAAKRFISAEPLLGPIDLMHIDVDGDSTVNCLRPESQVEIWRDCWSPETTGLPLEQCISDFRDEGFDYPPSDERPLPGLDWVITGGESGADARPMHPDWARSLRDQCHAAGVPFFFKQWGEWLHEEQFGFLNPPLDFDQRRWRHADDLGDVAHGSCEWPGSFASVGKHAAGRVLDGREHSEFPV